MTPPCFFRRTLLPFAAIMPLLAMPALAQISLTTAVDLALRNSPRVRSATADVMRAKAAVEEQRDVYIPNLTVGGTGYGRGFGYPTGTPTLINAQSSSLVFNYSQHDYIRAARAGYDAANFTLLEARQAIAEDVIVSFLSLDHDFARRAALREQQVFADRLVTIVRDRLDAGQDTPTGLTSTQLTAAQIRLAVLRAEDDLAVDAAHISLLTGISAQDVAVAPTAMPVIASPDPTQASLGSPTSPGVDAAYAAARSKRQLALGDARYLLRPQITFGAQYSRYSTIQNSNFEEYFGRRKPDGTLLPFQQDSFGIGVQLSIPILDYSHRAKARESAADATRAEYDADAQRNLFTEGRFRLQRSILELSARAEIARLDQLFAQQQLEVIAIQLNAPAATPTTPKEEQNAHISEREKYLTLLDARYQAQQAQINLLRQTGGLESWLRSLLNTSPSAASAPPSGSGTVQP
jgi:outer membrane protein TolC